MIQAAITLPAPDDFQDAKVGELMGLMARMSMTDQGQPVNRHLKVHVYTHSGSAVKDVMPAVTITGRSPGASRELPNVTACLLARHKVFPHFGDNLYLPEGMYTVTVGIGNETAVFEISL